MKKILSVFLMLIILILPASVLADTKHFVDGLDIQLALPDNFDVMTRDMDEDNPLATLYGENVAETKAYMEQNDLYFVGTDFEKYLVSIAIVYDDEIGNVSELSDVELKAMEVGMEAELGEKSVTLEKHRQIDFFRFERVEDEQAQIGYLTVENGKELVIGIFSFEDELTDEMRTFADNTFNSIYLGNSTFGEGWKNTVASNAQDMDNEFIYVIIAIAILIYVCIIPIIVYRFGIRKRPVEPNKAKWITSIIAIVLLVILYAGSGWSHRNSGLKAVAVLCQFVNYRILISGTKKYTQSQAISDEEAETVRKTETVQFVLESEEDIEQLIDTLSSLLVCPECGTELLKGTKLCHNCGKEMQ